MAEISAMENANMWLRTAEAAMKCDIYTTALYSMEMSVEIALKAVLMEFGINVPKVHNITSTLRSVFAEKRNALPKEFAEKEESILETYSDLLELRQLVGYTFEMGSSIDPKEKAKHYITRSKEVLSLCESAIKHIRRK